MPPTLALFGCLSFIIYLFYIDKKFSQNVSTTADYNDVSFLSNKAKLIDF